MQKSTVDTRKLKRRNQSIPSEKIISQGKRAREERSKGISKEPENNSQNSNSPYLLTITLNVNGLTSLTKRHRVTERLKKQDPTLCYIQETNINFKNTHRLKVKYGKTFSMQMETKRTCSYT